MLILDNDSCDTAAGATGESSADAQAEDDAVHGAARAAHTTADDHNNAHQHRKHIDFGALLLGETSSETDSVPHSMGKAGSGVGGHAPPLASQQRQEAPIGDSNSINSRMEETASPQPAMHNSSRNSAISAIFFPPPPQFAEADAEDGENGED